MRWWGEALTGPQPKVAFFRLARSRSPSASSQVVRVRATGLGKCDGWNETQMKEIPPCLPMQPTEDGANLMTTLVRGEQCKKQSTREAGQADGERPTGGFSLKDHAHRNLILSAA